MTDARPDSPSRTALLNHPSVGTGSARGGACLFLFGLPFFLAGALASLAGLGQTQSPGEGEPPGWVLVAMGGVFAIVGAGLLVAGGRAVLRERELQANLIDYAEEPWRFDGWHPEFARDLTGGVLAPFGAALFVGLFMVPFNYFMIAKSAPIFAQVIVGVFDVVLVAMVGHAFYRLGRRVKYGDGRLRYRELPLLASQPVHLTLRLPKALRGRFETLECTFRCAEQLWEQRGDQKTLMTYEVYSDARSIPSGELEGELTLDYAVPSEVPGTVLHGDSVFFYELEVKAETPGIDYRATYLLPIYR